MDHFIIVSQNMSANHLQMSIIFGQGTTFYKFYCVLEKKMRFSAAMHILTFQHSQISFRLSNIPESHFVLMSFMVFIESNASHVCFAFLILDSTRGL